MTQQYELPPLPDWMRNFQIPSDEQDDCNFSWLNDRMQDYARQAIALDRQERGEADYFTYVINGHHRGISETMPPDDAYDAGTLEQLYLFAPQPAESTELPSYKDEDDFHQNASTAELGAYQRGWNACRELTDMQPAEPVKEVSESEDDIVDLLAEYADHNTEHGRMSFDKWTLREAASALLARYRNSDIAAQPSVPPSIRAIIASDSYAMTFQSLGQYRAALLTALDKPPAAEQAQKDADNLHSLQVAEAFNADIPVTEQEEEEWKHLEDSQ